MPTSRNNNPPSERSQWLRIGLRVGTALAIIVLILAWQADVFTSKSEPLPLEKARVYKEEAHILEVVVTEEPSVRGLVGTLQARHPVELAARITGRVEQVFVGDGAEVSEGERLLAIDPEIPQSRVAQAEAAVSRLEARVEGSEAILRRIRQSTEANATPETRLVEARQIYEESVAALSEARAALAEAKTRLGYTDVMSATDGVVIELLVDPGDSVRAGQPVALIYERNALEAAIPIPSSLLAQVRQADELQLGLDTLDATVPVHLRTVQPAADPASRTVTARFDLDPPPDSLPGMFARLRVPGEPDKTILVPETAVQRVRQLAFVWVVAGDGRAARRIVRLGDGSTSGEVQVLAGLTSGDRILADPDAGLKPRTRSGGGQP